MKECDYCFNKAKHLNITYEDCKYDLCEVHFKGLAIHSFDKTGKIEDDVFSGTFSFSVPIKIKKSDAI